MYNILFVNHEIPQRQNYMHILIPSLDIHTVIEFSLYFQLMLKYLRQTSIL